MRAKIRRRKPREEIPKILPVWRKMGFSESTEEGERSCTRISDKGHAFKSAVKLCHLLCLPVTGAELWVRLALRIVGIHWAWKNEGKIETGKQAIKCNMLSNCPVLA